ncbi:ParA family protein [Desulfobacula sp.]|uniref:ParA family protein n=1 Tax=Desulfobacula sp. TaxID=2593537 RepID=UPI002637843E|nr:ParA family protein [Desulfobacula sp.]
MSKIITIAGQKGGAGKSVTAINLATSLALLEKKTLLIDCDLQGCSTQGCGINALDYNCDIASFLSGRAKITDTVVKTQVNYLDMIPAGFNLFRVALKLAKNPENEKILRLFLRDVEDEYEYIIIDPPSSYGFLSITAMTAADWLVVCMSVHHNSVEDFHCLLRTVKYIRTTHNVPLKIAGCLFNKCETKEDIPSFLENQNLPDIKQMVYNTFIPEDDNIKRSIDLKIPVALHDIKSPAAAAYLSFAKEIHFFFNLRGVL